MYNTNKRYDLHNNHEMLRLVDTCETVCSSLVDVLKQFLEKRQRVLHGFYRTYIRGMRRPFEARAWFDDFFAKGLSDRHTIDRDKDPISSAYHYASVELLIARYLRNHRITVQGSRVCDIGPGSGHWIDFYLSLGAAHCDGVEVSTVSAEYLCRKYEGRSDVAIHDGKAADVLGTLGDQFDLVNAIGVIFHIVDDDEWEDTLRKVGACLKPRAHFVVSGHFGRLDKVNVQFHPEDLVNKRLRSAAHWRRSLKRAGFGEIVIQRNHAYLFIDDPLPENNVLIATKR